MGTRMVKLALELYDATWIHWYHDQMKLKSEIAPCDLLYHVRTSPRSRYQYDYRLLFISKCFKSNAKCCKSYSSRTNSWTKVVKEMIPYIERTRDHIIDLEESNFGMTAPGLELNQMEHENVNVRIFIS